MSKTVYEYGDFMRSCLDADDKDAWIETHPEEVYYILSYFSSEMKRLVEIEGMGI